MSRSAALCSYQPNLRKRSFSSESSLLPPAFTSWPADLSLGGRTPRAKQGSPRLVGAWMSVDVLVWSRQQGALWDEFRSGSSHLFVKRPHKGGNSAWPLPCCIPQDP